ncbi:MULTISPECIES: urea ABC transporter ATP-binding subunit UrtE [Bifidobacterium]|jgi:urea transport system ATP-binding protein|uniref:ABC transporter n=1 Tax=Bifidobacterium subtile TaxID=77635 RepID=A0A087E5B2_9BIFI|nr:MULTISPECIES: urea ABC transporter ATP-binding subunit UrtE [Bifidobacterium]KFJ02963.1 ABC transporter [Bifidobacterium subtile]MCI1223494.1 urea ABC transporter ATP-binding subunit UrtE [Bifidobacterium subtile]MCI1649127.1 urea ABC transporter ATP-binding subunit UrtE [Bifidobacterium tibiigranuli]MCI2185545.1 urea ABC transporter ATP-binding subunit UrtE [Bifidobacterium tibiigranuli]MCI2203480.1 urea ABC transporter ATP-binding subunit UrtE [Bifidobacterium tibiigranuli]
MAMLEVKGLDTGYGKVTVVNGIDFDVNAGEWVSIVGNNGAGKTTLLKALLGLLPTSAGSVDFDGTDITRTAPNQRIRKGMAFVPQGQQSFGTMSVDENLHVVADRYGSEAKERYDEAVAMFPILKEFAGRRAGLLSGGQRQQLSIARALITRPKLMILDEPTEGIQPNIVAEIQQAIRAMAEDKGIGVILVEQKVQFAIERADRYYVLASGRFIASGEGGPDQVEAAKEAMRV